MVSSDDRTVEPREDRGYCRPMTRRRILWAGLALVIIAVVVWVLAVVVPAIRT
jgi:hypothetical protein